MGVATTLIGCLPSYALAGALAPLLLIVLRFVQGLAIGGQWAGAVLLACEERAGWPAWLLRQPGADRGADRRDPGEPGLSAGERLADWTRRFSHWGWRIPFLLSVVLIGLGLYVQLRLEDTAAFRELRALKERRDAEAAAERARARGSRSRPPVPSWPRNASPRRCSRRCGPTRSRSRSPPARSSRHR